MQHSLDVNVNVHGRIRVDLYLHTGPPGPSRAVGMEFRLNQGENMQGSITVDETSRTATLSFVDDHGDTDAAQPDGSTVTFSTDNPAVATVAADSSNPLQADITPAGEGSVNVTASVADAEGNALFPDASFALTVTAGAATADGFSLNAAQ